MFCSFDKNAEIARIYGRGVVIHPSDERWPELIANFPKLPGVRQVMEIRVESAMTSCGYAVPRMREMTPRDTLEKYWTQKRRAGEGGVLAEAQPAQYRRPADRHAGDQVANASLKHALI